MIVQGIEDGSTVNSLAANETTCQGAKRGGGFSDNGRNSHFFCSKERWQSEGRTEVLGFKKERVFHRVDYKNSGVYW